MRYIIANHKMKMNLEDVNKFIKEFDSLVSSHGFEDDLNIIIAPSFIHLPLYQKLTEKYNFIKIAAQDLHTKENGSYTGKVSVSQIKDFCSYSIIGHTETNNNTNDKIIKTELCLKNSIKTIVCSAEPINEFQEIISKNIMNISKKSDILLAYEDPSNISQNGVYKQKPIQEIFDSVKKIKEKYNNNHIIYGGSINLDNIEEIAKVTDLSGILIGNASLDAKTFFEIIKKYK